LVHDEKAMRFIIDVIGEDFICLGSDYPFPLGEHRPGQLLERMKMKKEVREKMLFKNALDWLDLEPE
jgi:aminocarboxymuconate-semialdehyde decarboxylase